ncbi:helix-turn-helix domain-containing protein [Blastopirellula marina]|uniref:Probable transcriptional regulator n=1 Tax=Blastopirellula marina DSM 3645 TaxID=314230 RepID=A3ZY19_9BACT|nr:AraC family transcriptional regulator [Blastopirellula marina]EAQ78553.1 probable transcriptional regulator [Blastopirellula marina DSM 3645]
MQEFAGQGFDRAAPNPIDNQVIPDLTASLINHLKMRCLVTHVSDLQPAAPLTLTLAAPMFHYVVSGRCQVELSDQSPAVLSAGDLIVDFRNVRQVLRSFGESAESPFGEPQPRYNRILSGRIHSSGIEILPGLCNVPHSIFRAAEWGDDGLLGRILPLITPELIGDRQGGIAVVNLMLTLVIVEILREQLTTLRADSTGWLKAFQDEAISPILAAMLRQPEYPWSVERLAAVNCMARSTFARRFREVVGEAPMDVLTTIRMQIAIDLVKAGANLKDIARRVGYGSIQSLTSAFRRRFGVSPAQFRSNLRGPTSDLLFSSWPQD